MKTIRKRRPGSIFIAAALLTVALPTAAASSEQRACSLIPEVTADVGARFYHRSRASQRRATGAGGLACRKDPGRLEAASAGRRQGHFLKFGRLRYPFERRPAPRTPQSGDSGAQQRGRRSLQLRPESHRACPSRSRWQREHRAGGGQHTHAGGPQVGFVDRTSGL